MLSLYDRLLRTFLLSLLFSGAASAKTVCTGDFSNHHISMSLGVTLSKACVTENEHAITMSAQLTNGSFIFDGSTQKTVDGTDVVYTNTRNVRGIETRTTVRMKPKDRIRFEGSMADHFVGSVEIAEKENLEYEVKHQLQGVHFYSGDPDHKIHWGYNRRVGPDKWGTLDSQWEICKEGTEQSPIRLSRREALDGPVAPLQFQYNDVSASLVNNGHALQVNVAEGSTFSIGGKRYKLLQFHAHTPSEHMVNGKVYPMEVHLVHQAEDKSLAVIGVLFDTSPSTAPDEALALALREFPHNLNDPREFSQKVNPDRWMPPANKRSYFTYPGSLTTPPCTQGVTWYVMDKPIRVSRDQVKQVRKRIGDKNARHLSNGELLPINGRPVRFSSK